MITFIPEPNFTSELPNNPGKCKTDPKFVQCELWKNNERYFIIYNLTWSTAGYIISIDLLELGTRKLITLKYEDMKKFTEEKRMVEWVPEK